MPVARKSQTRKPANRLYRGAKISEYQFKRVLWSFVRDEPVAEAAKRIALSANSINAIYGKLRVFFTELGVFEDIYEGRDPREGTSDPEAMEGLEYRLIPFHVARVKGKRRTKPTAVGEVDYHWNESYWRFQYAVLTEGRAPEAIYRMMFAHLLAVIRVCGPVGAPRRNHQEALHLKLHQLDQRILWLERNSPLVRDARSRAAIHEIWEIPVSDRRHQLRKARSSV